MSYRIELNKAARAEVKALSGNLRAQALALFESLKDNPLPLRARELRDKPGIYRIWLAGRWRIVYEVDDQERVVVIRRVRHKDAIDYTSV